MTPQKLIEAAQEIERRYPDAELVKNTVGNLWIGLDEEYLGYLDLADGEVCWNDE